MFISTTTGDIHGQFDELRRIFELGGMPSNKKYLFLGDYVDRGPKQLETICLLFAFKVHYPETFHMLRGNHESESVSSYYGFLDECNVKFNKNIFDIFVTVFDCMPVAAIVERKMFCVHAGISPELMSFDQIRNIPRPVPIPDYGLLCDLVWSDPHVSTRSWSKNHSRGISWFYGPQAITDFFRDFNMEVIVRAHEVVPEGFLFFAGLNCVTLYSTTTDAGNKGAFMHVDENSHCTLYHI